LSFPAAELEQVEARSGNGAVLATGADIDRAAAGGDIAGFTIIPAFMGLLGAAGALPVHYTERLAEREARRDRAARAFLDVFTSRALVLHYEAWKKYRLAMQYELDRRERFLPLVLSLSGLGAGLRDRLSDEAGGVFDEAIAQYAGAVRQ